VSNSGPDTAQNVTLPDTLPGSAIYISAIAIPGQCYCYEVGGVVTCSLGDIPNGGSTSIEIVVTTTAAGSLTNSASVSANSSDRDLQNNSASETTTVDPTEYLIYLPITSRASN